jgi:TrmH family RNA methyltransferase
MSKTPWTGSVEKIRRTITARGRRGQGLYGFEGERLLKRALAAGVAIDEIVLGEELLRSVDGGNERLLELVREASQRGARISEAPREVLRELGEGRNSAQVVVLARLPETVAIRDALLEQSTSTILVAVDIDEPGNVGALVRTALASGVRLFVGLGATDPFHPKAVRTSLGAIFKLPWAWLPTLSELGAAFAGADVQRVAAVATLGTPLLQANLGPRRVVLYLGNEARGLPPEIGEYVDECVTIPMPDGVDSFSVNAAAAIVLYETNRRRTLDQSK